MHSVPVRGSASEPSAMNHSRNLQRAELESGVPAGMHACRCVYTQLGASLPAAVATPLAVAGQLRKLCNCLKIEPGPKRGI